MPCNDTCCNEHKPGLGLKGISYNPASLQSPLNSPLINDRPAGEGDRIDVTPGELDLQKSTPQPRREAAMLWSLSCRAVQQADQVRAATENPRVLPPGPLALAAAAAEHSMCLRALLNREGLAQVLGDEHVLWDFAEVTALDSLLGCIGGLLLPAGANASIEATGQQAGGGRTGKVWLGAGWEMPLLLNFSLHGKPQAAAGAEETPGCLRAGAAGDVAPN